MWKSKRERWFHSPPFPWQIRTVHTLYVCMYYVSVKFEIGGSESLPCVVVGTKWDLILNSPDIHSGLRIRLWHANLFWLGFTSHNHFFVDLGLCSPSLNLISDINLTHRNNLANLQRLRFIEVINQSQWHCSMFQVLKLISSLYWSFDEGLSTWQGPLAEMRESLLIGTFYSGARELFTMQHVTICYYFIGLHLIAAIPPFHSTSSI
jgi:hypothetical protein